MRVRRHQIIKQLNQYSPIKPAQSQGYAPAAAPCSKKSRRQALTLLGLATAGALVTVSCHGQSLSRNAQAFEPTPTGRPLKTLKLKTIQVDTAGQIVAEPAVKATYFDEPYLQQQLHKLLPLRMVKIPAGEFMMGSPDTETDHQAQEGPQRLIQVPSFYIGSFTVTQKQYEIVMGKNPSYFTKDGANLPVEQIAWVDAEAFCNQLSELTGRSYRLPSEAEWEYACRAGTTTRFCYGEKLTTEIANFFADFSFGDNPEENYRNMPVAADSFWPNAFGLYNMHGNVSEWCADDYHDSYDGAPSDANLWLSGNPEASKVMRGGSWFNDTPYCRSAARDRNTRIGRSNAFGFRVVCTSPV